MPLYRDSTILHNRINDRRDNITNAMIALIQGQYSRSWARVLRDCWKFDLVHGKRRMVVFGKNLTKFVFAFAYFLMLANSNTKYDDERKTQEPRFGNMGLIAIISSFLLYDLYTIIYVITKMLKVGKGCCNKKKTSGRNDNYRTRRLEYKFKWYEFVGPLASLASHVSFFDNF